jgi:hypothetical protein
VITRRWLLAFGLALGLGMASASSRVAVRGAEVPSRLTDRDFWRLVTEASEPGGYFRSENLTSNELWFQHVIPDLVARTRPGGAYLGVGPEQNFTYIAAVRPAIAIIVDIRRGNVWVQLMYKALFELSTDRADFVSMLFSKPRPSGVGSQSAVGDLFAAFALSPASDALFQRNLKAIQQRLSGTGRLPLPPEDRTGIEHVYRTFYESGFAIRYWPTYADLMTATDRAGIPRSYLATEANFAFVKDLESRNLVVPVVGDFGGPKAIRAVGTYLKQHGATVAAFYLSNVEQYLYQDRKWTAFCQNVATLPLDDAGTFIRSSSRGGGAGRFVSSLGAMAAEVKNCGGG